MKYLDKHHLTKEQSLFLAKKQWDENVYCGMKMENRAVIFPQIKTILEGVNVPNVQLDDIQAILNMRDAWRYLIQSFEEPLTLEYICKLNEYTPAAVGFVALGCAGYGKGDHGLPPPFIPASSSSRVICSRAHRSSMSRSRCS